MPKQIARVELTEGNDNIMEMAFDIEFESCYNYLNLKCRYVRTK